MDAILPLFIEHVLPLLATLLTALIGLAVDALRKRLKSETARNALDSAERVACLVVDDVNQTLAKEMRARAEDGRLTRDERLSLLATAKMRVQTSLGQRGLAELRTHYGDIDEFLSSIIEAKVREAKIKEGEF